MVLIYKIYDSDQVWVWSGPGGREVRVWEGPGRSRFKIGYLRGGGGLFLTRTWSKIGQVLARTGKNRPRFLPLFDKNRSKIRSKMIDF